MAHQGKPHQLTTRSQLIHFQHSSVTLVGELLFKFSGISGKAELDDDEEADVAAVETYRRALVEVLGKERRDRILSALYIVRHDSVIAVRQAAMHIWKVLVHNTPRTGTKSLAIQSSVTNNVHAFS